MRWLTASIMIVGPLECTHMFQHIHEPLDSCVAKPSLVLLWTVLTDPHKGVLCSFSSILLILMSKLAQFTDIIIAKRNMSKWS